MCAKYNNESTMGTNHLALYSECPEYVHEVICYFSLLNKSVRLKSIDLYLSIY